MNDWLWYLTRASGIVATVLMAAALAWGFLFSARETGNRLRPAWWLDLHNWLGGLALVFTGVHLLAVFADSDLALGLVDILVPNSATTQTAAITWGVVALYLLAAVVFTSWPKRRFKRPVWRAIHLLSVPATLFAGIHGYQTGSDATAFGFRALLVVLAGAAVYPAAIRLFGLVSSNRARPLDT
ncbi:MAG: ferric reductase-like transmembrane domain-containing protein [Acidimicrobiia bacterium]